MPKQTLTTIILNQPLYKQVGFQSGNEEKAEAEAKLTNKEADTPSLGKEGFHKSTGGITYLGSLSPRDMPSQIGEERKGNKAPQKRALSRDTSEENQVIIDCRGGVPPNKKMRTNGYNSTFSKEATIGENTTCLATDKAIERGNFQGIYRVPFQ
ncbi:hypothetical protein RFI_19751 [Reticulomyxa filosa]|uniref:Uncharacterized protein n=1 Tax=Reticulomyxa filosa TaxID=46433 RepID=X6MV94_RETFI|nr:hypothetical protein RFI_19751 [Reticulomyxa filosa]|eukprot:ETO17571.1 hypothetical protein RFI_19751 [Reticulomyxa filosa]